MVCFGIVRHISFFSQKMGVRASEMPGVDATSYRTSLVQVGSVGQQHENLLGAW